MHVMRHEILPLAVTVFTILIEYIKADGLIEVFRWKQMDFYNKGESGEPREDAAISANKHIYPDSGAIIFPDQLPYRPHRSKREITKLTWADELIRSITPTTRCDIDEPYTNTASYIPYNNVPMGATHFRGRLFITMPRRRIGIPSTLNYVDMRKDGNNSSPKLYAYNPKFESNYLSPTPKPNASRLISVYRTTVDACRRLWFIDTGMLEYPGNRTQVQRPSIWVIDLSNDRVIRRFEIPEAIVAIGRGLVSITIDVSERACGRAFAYIPDLFNDQLYVYSFQKNRIWSFSHNYFSFDPLGGDLNIGGQTFRWNDGIFSVALGPQRADGYRYALFHAMASTNEFSVSTEVLQNEENSQRCDHGRDFALLGSRGAKRQSNRHAYDPRTGVVFYAEIQRNGVGCWNTNKQFSPQNHGTVAQDETQMIYPSDLTIDEDGTMWILTNSIPIHIYSSLDSNVVNFRVWKRKTIDAIKNTICENF